MDRGIGKGRTREDHADVSNQLYAAYSQGADLRDLVAIVGEDALSDIDRSYLEFADQFEKQFVSQGKQENRTIEDTLSIAWDLFSKLPKAELKKVDESFITKYLSREQSSTADEKPEEKPAAAKKSKKKEKSS